MNVTDFLKITREIVTHIIALIIILPLSVLLFNNSQNPAVTVSPVLLSLASIVVGFYFGKYVKMD